MAGILRATGHIYLALIDTYGVSRFQANLPFSVRNVVRNLGGPLAGAVGQRFGLRNVTLLGGLLGSLGILLCSFAPNVLWIALLWGGMHGLGVALGNTLSQVVVTQYFVKHRATASGLANSGSCFGSFVLPALTEYMLFHFGLSGSFLLTGGLLMHVIPAALILKEPSWLQRKENIITGNPSWKRKANTGEFHVCKESQNVLIIDFKKHRSYDDSETNEEGPKKCDRNLNAGKNGIDNLAFTGSTTDIVDISDKVENLKFSDMKSGNITSEEVEAQINEQQKQETSFLKAIIRTFSNPMFFLISLSLAALAFLIDPVFTVHVDFLKDKGGSSQVFHQRHGFWKFGGQVRFWMGYGQAIHVHTSFHDDDANFSRYLFHAALFAVRLLYANGHDCCRWNDRRCYNGDVSCACWKVLAFSAVDGYWLHSNFYWIGQRGSTSINWLFPR
ncbi:hypothetical protein TNCV_1423671 [Trichonephila clavipes]|nr:hypothetical protein TNCV_1423671 [Trichonephila clavipes]